MHFLKRHPLRTCKAQTMMEYLLVMVVIVVIVFLGFRNTNDSILSQTQNKTAEYFDTGAMAIMGGHYDGVRMVRADPSKIDGGWCAWTVCINGYKSRECACPRPAFGGAACPGDAASGTGAITECSSSPPPPPPEKCYSYRCHLGFGEQGGTTECECPSPIDPGCNPGDELWVCHHKTGAEECGYCCYWDVDACVRSYEGECKNVTSVCAQ